ncbi:unnamed protein product [Camellia sinensis]
MCPMFLFLIAQILCPTSSPNKPPFTPPPPSYSSSYPRNDCNACRRPCNGFTYNCSICDFNIDLMCALLVKNIELNFHEHPLIPIQRPALFLCNACRIKHEGSSYKCGTCKFWVHQNFSEKWEIQRNCERNFSGDIEFSLDLFALYNSSSELII